MADSFLGKIINGHRADTLRVTEGVIIEESEDTFTILTYEGGRQTVSRRLKSWVVPDHSVGEYYMEKVDKIRKDHNLPTPE